MSKPKAQPLPRGIRLRGQKYYVDVTVAGRRRTRTCDSLAEAITTQAALRSEPTSGPTKGVAPPGTPWTIEESQKATIRTRWRGSKAEKSATLNSERALEFFGKDTLLDDITPDWLDEYVEHLIRRGNNAAGINRKLAALSTMFTTALDRGGCRAKPKMPRQREGSGRIRWMTEAEEQKAAGLLIQWGEYDMLAVMRVLIDTGLRLSELWNLEARDVTGTKISIWENKTSHPRSVPMTSRVQAIIKRRLETTEQGQKLFPYSAEWIRARWLRLRAGMGMHEDPQFVPYMLRHTCASRLVQRGATIPVVQQWMGHKTIQMTMRYAHLAPSHLEDAAKLLETAALRGEGEK